MFFNGPKILRSASSLVFHPPWPFSRPNHCVLSRLKINLPSRISGPKIRQKIYPIRHDSAGKEKSNNSSKGASNTCAQPTDFEHAICCSKAFQTPETGLPGPTSNISCYFWKIILQAPVLLFQAKIEAHFSGNLLICREVHDGLCW